MIVQPHKNYDEYVTVQINRSKKRTNYGRRFVQWASEEMLDRVNTIIHDHISEPKTMVCHGCRTGFEVDFFGKLNPATKVYGTDLYARPYKYDRSYFREIDFDTVPEDWLTYFDVIYSNSIDHSRNPVNTLKAWRTELTHNGVIYCTFPWGVKPNDADCFCLSPDALENSGDVPKYQTEIGWIAEKAGLTPVYFTEPTKFNSGHPYAVDAVLRRA